MTKPVFRRTGRRRPPLRAVLRTLTGAIDLASIMVGVIVIGVIAGVIAATVFAVIPWTQDRAAQANLDAVRTAESVTQVKDGKFLDMAGLIATNQIQAAPKVNVVTDAAGSCWAAASKSAAGPVYISSNLKPIAVLYVAGDTSGCTDLTALIASVGGPDPAAAPPAASAPCPGRHDRARAGGAGQSR